MSEINLYAQRDTLKLGKFYTDHVQAMTAEALHSKSDIAAELAHRDLAIDTLQARITELEAEKKQLALNALAENTNGIELQAKLAAQARQLASSSEQDVVTYPPHLEDRITNYINKLVSNSDTVEDFPVGFSISHISPWSALTDEANQRTAFVVKRCDPPFCTADGTAVWHGATMQAAIQAAMRDLKLDQIKKHEDR